MERCLAGVAHIIHAGDIGAADVIDRLRTLALVTAIRGNVDVGDWADSYPETQTVRIGGRCFYILHDLTGLEDKPAPTMPTW
ncbi:metallophosphoesterase family protein [Bradyrhizobium arachidis]|uniref:metallophosphoesterase family protein n=1 Tax=Bradyrhizobium arachidis TaxID=858423 RepID=UPI00322188BD